MSQYQVVGYRVTYMSSGDAPWMADIRCYNSTDLLAAQSGLIRFYPDSAPLPADKVVGGIPVVNYHLSQFRDILSLLQNEDYTTVSEFSYDAGVTGVSGWGVSGGMEEAGEMEGEGTPELDTGR